MSLRVAAFEAVGGNCSTLLLSGQVMGIVRLTSCWGASSILLAKCFATTAAGWVGLGLIATVLASSKSLVAAK